MFYKFTTSETTKSNTITITGTANGAVNSTNLLPSKCALWGNYNGNYYYSIAPSPFIAEKNAFTQNPVVRLYEIYYPGEWYPDNQAGNPTGDGMVEAGLMMFQSDLQTFEQSWLLIYNIMLLMMALLLFLSQLISRHLNNLLTVK